MSLELFGVVFFLGAALFLYAILGGADFGAGILELFLGVERRDEQSALIARAIAPVWEANHVWLIIAVVILFMGFPGIFASLSIHLHLPIIATLLGIVVRGTAFTFRHYDVSRKSDGLYSLLFAASSLWTSFFLGLTLGAAIGGRIQLKATDFLSAYVRPWLSPFPIAVGFFIAALFSLVAAVYLLGETSDADLRKMFHRKVRWATATVMGAGAFVFFVEDTGAFRRHFVSSTTSQACFAIATMLWVPLHAFLRRADRRGATRVLAAGIAFFVFAAWYIPQYPTLIRVMDGGVIHSITFAEAASPISTLRALLGALLAGIVLILPALGYLLWVYKRDFQDSDIS